jgi:hypothetical protein
MGELALEIMARDGDFQVVLLKFHHQSGLKPSCLASKKRERKSDHESTDYFIAYITTK